VYCFKGILSVGPPSQELAPGKPATLELYYCRDLDGWPRSWMGREKDLPPSEELVAYFAPFLEHPVSSDQSLKTIQKHVDNLWADHPRPQGNPFPKKEGH
jgi:hypothetical protein